MVSDKPLIAALILAGLVSSDAALARNSYCCNDANGKLVCGDMLPAACQKRAYRILDERGRLVREVEAPLSAEQRELRQAELMRKQEEEKKAAEEKRRNIALLASYPNEKDIDVARDRALVEFEKASVDTQKRFDEAMKRKKKLDKEKEFYEKKPLPADLKKQLEDNANDIKNLQAALDGRKQEAETLRQKFEEEKQRYIELKYGKKAAAPVAAGAAPSAADKRPR